MPAALTLPGTAVDDPAQRALDLCIASAVGLGRGLDDDPPERVVEGALCTGAPTCALMICWFAAARWSSGPEPARSGAAR